MKGQNTYLWVILISLLTGALLTECFRGKDRPRDESLCTEVRDTIRHVDTVRYFGLAAKREVSLGTRFAALPSYRPMSMTGNPGNRLREATGNTEEPMCEDLSVSEQEDEEETRAGMARDGTGIVEIPITQREYEGEDYHAWVSGYDPKLDSIFVYSRLERVTIRKPPDRAKRWGIGVFAGYGYTPAGFQPCAGVSINYNIWSF